MIKWSHLKSALEDHHQVTDWKLNPNTHDEHRKGVHINFVYTSKAEQPQSAQIAVWVAPNKDAVAQVSITVTCVDGQTHQPLHQFVSDGEPPESVLAELKRLDRHTLIVTTDWESADGKTHLRFRHSLKVSLAVGAIENIAENVSYAFVDAVVAHNMLKLPR